MQTVKPRIMSGIMELLPKEQMVFDEMKNTVENTMKLYGLTTIDTPTLELSEILLAKAGGETEKQIYRFNKGDTDLTMRFDLTVPTARYVSMNKQNLSFPFRRYQIGKVYRGERAQKGRFREFYQCDADIIGDGDLPFEADAEIISLLAKIYDNLKIEADVHVSNRKIMCGALEQFGLQEYQNQILGVLDKAEKVSEDALVEMLQEYTLGKTEQVLSVFKCKTLEEIENLNIQNELLAEGVNELKTIFSLLEAMGTKNVVLNLNIIRGLDYYTGTVFEGRMKEFPALSIGGGGRYENLTGYFSSSKMPGVGFGMGLTRLFALLKDLGRINGLKENYSQIAIIPFDETKAQAFNLATKLRNQGVNSEVLYAKSFKAKMNLANKTGIPYIIVLGEDEVKTGIYGLKNMQTGEVKSVKLEEIKGNL